MPNNNASTNLTVPPSITTVAQLLPALNDSFRQIEQLVGGTKAVGTSTGSSSTGSSSTGQVVLSVPGTLGMGSNLAPLLTFASSVSPSGLVALLKQTAIGAVVTAQILVAGVSYAQLTIPAGQTQVSIPGAGAIAAGALVTLNLISVGTTFPGAGLSVILQGV